MSSEPLSSKPLSSEPPRPPLNPLAALCLLALGLLVPAALWGVLYLASASAPPPLTQAVPTPCQPAAPSLWMGQERPSSSDGTFTLASNGVVSEQVCSSGTLSFRARGTPAEGLFPLMTVSLNSQTLLTTRASTEKTYTVPIKEAGLVTVAFHDDRYLPDLKPPQDRNLFVQDWKFQPQN